MIELILPLNLKSGFMRDEKTCLIINTSNINHFDIEIWQHDLFYTITFLDRRRFAGYGYRTF